VGDSGGAERFGRFCRPFSHQTFASPSAGILQDLVFRPMLLSLPLLALLFGLATGYFEASTYIDCYKPAHQEKWYEVLGIIGAPGT
jgi:hypothetical protein